MANLSKERPIPLAKLATYCGKHYRTVLYWCQRGFRVGRTTVKLESFVINGRWHTTTEAYSRFLERQAKGGR